MDEIELIKPEIQNDIIDKWQRVINLMTNILKVPVGLVMHVVPPKIEVFISSQSQGNPYEKGEMANLNTGLYCETVIKDRKPLLVPNALNDPLWDHNPDIELGMTYYYGFPIIWPDGEIFGTICILDEKDNPYATSCKDLIYEFKIIIEKDLQECVRIDDMQYQQKQMEEQVKERTADLRQANEKLKNEIQERKNQALAFKKSESKFKDIANKIPGVVFQFNVLHDGTSNFTYASPLAEELFGLPADLNSNEWKLGKRIHPDDRAAFLESIERSINKETDWHFEGRMIISENCEKWFQGISSPSRYGDELFFNGILLDVTERKQIEEALRLSEDNLNQAQKVAGIGSWTLNIAENELLWSEETYILFGVPIGTKLSYEKFISCVHPDDRDVVNQAWEDALGGAPYDIIHRILTGKKIKWVHERAELTFNDSGEVIWGIGTVQDITEMKYSEDALRKSETLYRSLFENANDAIFLMDGIKFIDCNPKTLDMFKIKRKEILKSTPIDVSPEKQPDGSLSITKAKKIVDSAMVGNPQQFEWKHTRVDGSEFDAEVSLSKLSLPDKEPILAIVRDITSRKEAETKLQTSLKEKEILLKELYHRTKNNMQVISSYMRIRSRSLNDPNAVNIINEINNKIQTMALIHQTLYESQDLSKLNFKNYLTRLFLLIQKNYENLAHPVKFEMQAQELFLLIDTAMPLGLVVNELIVNAYKHAFPINHKGVISLLLKKKKNTGLVLTVSDNGTGLPENFIISNDSSMGLQTVVSIVEHQLQGSITFKNNNGLHCRITVNEELYEKRV